MLVFYYLEFQRQKEANVSRKQKTMHVKATQQGKTNWLTNKSNVLNEMLPAIYVAFYLFSFLADNCVIFIGH